MDIEIAKECSRLSEEEKITFREFLLRLYKAGVESYAAAKLMEKLPSHLLKIESAGI